MKLSRRAFAAATALSPIALGAARAQGGAGWAPSKPVRLIVAYPPGGPTDAIARIVANDLGKSLGQPVVVENPSGASGAIGTRNAALAEPDGHTITLGNNQTHGNNMFMLKDPGYDAIKDFAPLAGVGAFEHVFVVSKKFGAKSVQEVIARAKDKPGAINYGSTGIGSGSHLSTELFMARTGIKMTHVPYRGAAPLVTDLLNGTIDISNSTLASVFKHIEAGALPALAIGSPKRNAKLPNLATLEEQGVKGANAASWTAFFAPAKTPQAALARLSAEIMASLKKPVVIEAIDKFGFTVDVRDPEQFRAYHAEEMATWKAIAQQAGIKAG
jgi:tripartite-type tricarboxylate transporter receptor subunit TctC